MGSSPKDQNLIRLSRSRPEQPALNAPPIRNGRGISVLHSIAHVFGLNIGSIEIWYDNNIPMVGFKCNKHRGFLDRYFI